VTTLSAEAAAAALTSVVPLIQTLGLEHVPDDSGMVFKLTDVAEHRNHIGGPHAGLLFTVAESASGAAILQYFGDLLDRYIPVPATAEIRFKAVALGDVTATARLTRSREEVLAELEAGGRPRVPVEVEVRDAAGKVTTLVTVVWAFRPMG
jgi:acyl-coenzyme A thioesterase PaaI-like protein